MSKPRSRLRHKGRSESGGYFAKPHAVMASANYLALSVHAHKLLDDLGFQYRGHNNGDLGAAWKLLRPRGWKSRDTLARALAELLYYGLIEKTRQGGLNRCSLYALTWLAVDECHGKLDGSATRVPSGLWGMPKPPMPKPEKQDASTATVSNRHAERVNGERVVHLPTRKAG